MTQKGQQIFTTSSTLQVDSGHKPVAICISAYSDCILVILNQTGAAGSIIRGELQKQVAPDESEEFEQTINANKDVYVYEAKVLFGATDIQFYEILSRKILSIIFEENNSTSSVEIKQKIKKVMINVGLQIKNPTFSTAHYFTAIAQELKKLVKEVI